METLEHALARGATIHAEYMGGAITCVSLLPHLIQAIAGHPPAAALRRPHSLLRFLLPLPLPSGAAAISVASVWSWRFPSAVKSVVCGPLCAHEAHPGILPASSYVVLCRPIFRLCVPHLSLQPCRTHAACYRHAAMSGSLRVLLPPAHTERAPTSLSVHTFCSST